MDYENKLHEHQTITKKPFFFNTVSVADMAHVPHDYTTRLRSVQNILSNTMYLIHKIMTFHLTMGKS